MLIVVGVGGHASNNTVKHVRRPPIARRGAVVDVGLPRLAIVDEGVGGEGIL